MKKPYKNNALSAGRCEILQQKFVIKSVIYMGTAYLILNPTVQPTYTENACNFSYRELDINYYSKCSIQENSLLIV